MTGVYYRYQTEPVETDVVNATIAEPEPVIKGTIHNKLGHRRSARLARNNEDGQVHLTYCGNPYTLTKEGSVQYVLIVLM